jgi:hypothetical protein
MDKEYAFTSAAGVRLRRGISSAKPRLRSGAAAALCVIFAAAAAAVYFAAWHYSSDEALEASVENAGAASCFQAADNYFRAFSECDSSRYVASMSAGRRKNQAALFDSEKEFYDSYESQFEDEREYFTALYGSDFSIEWGISESADAGIDSVDESGVNSAQLLDVSAVIRGRKAECKVSGSLTAIETDTGWYIYDSNFEKIFW